MKTRDKYIYKHLNNKIKMTSIGLMSGTSMDGVDISCIVTDGNNYFHQIFFHYVNAQGPYVHFAYDR